MSGFDIGNAGVNAAGAFDYDFKIGVVARSRSTLGSQCIIEPGNTAWSIAGLPSNPQQSFAVVFVLVLVLVLVLSGAVLALDSKWHSSLRRLVRSIILRRHCRFDYEHEHR